MKTLGNILWFLTFGLMLGLSYFLTGIVCCLTIVLIPFGKACFRLAKLSFLPFGKTVETDYESHPVGNVIWMVFGGAEGAITYAVVGAICCVTLIGIPFGKQFFKLMKLSALPFGATVEK